MAFLGGLQGLGALAGGVGTGIGQGTALNQYLQNQQAQNLAGNILQGYGGGQPSTGGGLLGGLGSALGGLGNNLFGGGQQASAAPAAAPPLSGLGGAGAGAQPISQAPVPGADPGQPGTANAASNLFGGGQGISPMSPLATQANQTPQPQQAPQPDQSASQQPPQPFDASQRFGGQGGQQQMTLPQAIQWARRVAPNANGGQVYRGVMALTQGGMVAGVGMTPYQAAQLARETNLTNAQIENLQDEARKRHADTANQAETQTRERDKEADTQADKGVTEALSAVNETKAAVKENREAQRTYNSTIKDLVGQPEDNQKTDQWKAEYKEATDRLSDLKGEEKRLLTEQHAAEDAHAAAVKKREGAVRAARTYGSGAGSSQPDYVTTPDGKLMHYKGTGPRDDPSSYEEVQ